MELTAQTPAETPPRVWGKHLWPRTFSNVNRNTPTCVGKTLPRLTLPLPMRKHPHVCGENLYGDTDLALTTETPPRVWGKPDPDAQFSYPVRNTPTCVGKTYVSLIHAVPL